MPKTKSATRSTSKPRAPRRSNKAPLTAAEIGTIHLLAQGKTYAEAEAALDLPDGTVEAFLKRTEVQAYRRNYEEKFCGYMAEEEVKRLARKNITREVVLEKLMDLASYTPERTRGSIDGQVNALREVAALMGMRLDEDKLARLFGNMTEGQLAQAAPATTRTQ